MAAVGQAPAEAKPGALIVPEEHAKLGKVYQVVSGEKSKVTFLSKAKAEEFKGTTKAITGYVISPTEESALPASFVAGEFRVPVLSLDTDNKTRDEHLQSKRWLDAEAYPEVIFTLTKVSDAKLIRKREETSVYKATLAGTMTILGNKKDITVEANMTMTPESAATKKSAAGDQLTISCKFPVSLEDFKVGVGDQAITGDKVAKVMQITVDLMMASTRE